MASNRAAWLIAEKSPSLVIKSAPCGVPKAHQILIKNHAIAINPIDWKLQHLAIYPLTYPTILGQDVAGSVVETGAGVTSFAKGDRVIGNTVGFATKDLAETAFQEYTILQTDLVCKLPDSIAFEDGVVLPLGIGTAAAALFVPENLDLQVPTEPKRASTGKTVLIWGGASCVGNCAIQLATAAGYEVVTTASPKNFAAVKKLGAVQAFDYNSPSVVSELIDFLKERTLVGTFDTIGGAAAWTPTVEVVSKSRGNKFVATTLPFFPTPPQGIEMKQIQSLSILGTHVAKAVWEDYLPLALAAGTLVPAPEALMVGTGLESIQEAVNVVSKGLSARKAVVVL